MSYSTYTSLRYSSHIHTSFIIAAITTYHYFKIYGFALFMHQYHYIMLYHIDKSFRYLSTQFSNVTATIYQYTKILGLPHPYIYIMLHPIGA